MQTFTKTCNSFLVYMYCKAYLNLSRKLNRRTTQILFRTIEFQNQKCRIFKGIKQKSTFFKNHQKSINEESLHSSISILNSPRINAPPAGGVQGNT